MINHLSLSGIWQLAAFNEDQGDWTRVQSPYPIDAPVPGEVHPALEAAGVIPDPFWGNNCEQVQWVEEKEWWYRRTFRLPRGFLQRRAYLEFDGLDTLAVVYLNGIEVGSSENMFIPHRFDVTGLLHPRATNTVEVVFSPVVKALRRMNLDKEYYVRYDAHRIGVRKMQASFGWDWNPRLVGAGIWRDARVVSEGDLAIRDIHVRPDCTVSPMRVHVDVAVANHTGIDLPVQLRLQILANDTTVAERTLDVRLSACGARLDAELDVPDAELWWPNGWGGQPLYTAQATLFANRVEEASRDTRFGFRTIELNERDEGGNPAFFFRINGKPIFMKGANWIPPDSFPSRVSEEKYERLLSMSRDAHFNMMRVWGGGCYEHDTFYRLCDEYGILLWHDFMFALADYPSHDAFTGNALREVESVIRRLRNHPSVAVWCSNSECELDKEVDKRWSGKRLFHELIPEAARVMDGTRPIWFSSPFGGEIAHSNKHGTYHGEPWFHTAHEGVEQWRSRIESDHGLFMAEFPTQGVPALESLRRFIPEEELWPPRGKVWDEHAINNAHRESKIGMTGLQALEKNICQIMGRADGIEAWARLGGIVQGEFLRSQIEYYRRHMFGIGGAMLWMFDDAWPAVDYSIVDYFGVPKAAYFYVKRAYAPVLLCFSPEGGKLAAWAVNDTDNEIIGNLRLMRIDAIQGLKAEENHGIGVPPRSVRRLWTGTMPRDARRQWWAGRIENSGETVARAVHSEALPRDRAPLQSNVHVEIRMHDGIPHIRLVADALACCLSFEGLPDGVVVDDDYFDLLPNDPREIAVHGLSKGAAEDIGIRAGFQEPGAINITHGSS